MGRCACLEGDCGAETIQEAVEAEEIGGLMAVDLEIIRHKKASCKINLGTFGTVQVGAQHPALPVWAGRKGGTWRYEGSSPRRWGHHRSSAAR